MRSTLRLTCLCTAALVSGAALAQSNTKPGLWEIESQIGGSPELDQAMAQMQQQMANMPPAQRKMMEDMMAAQGVRMGKGSGKGMAVQVCITPEMAARNDLPTQTEGDCTTKIGARSGNTMKVSFQCTNPPSSGEGTYTFRGNTGYDMDMVVRNQQNGKTSTMTLKGTGRWLAADCGKVKPLSTLSGKQ